MAKAESLSSQKVRTERSIGIGSGTPNHSTRVSFVRPVHGLWLLALDGSVVLKRLDLLDFSRRRGEVRQNP